jgi:glyoxylase-like metal-dependent hydrolase (beta-lactamase superfamily II)
MTRAHALLLIAAGAAGCATGQAEKKGPPGALVQKFTQGSLGGHANVYWFETPAGAVIVDVPLLPSEARKLRGDMDHPYRIYVTSARAERIGSIDEMRKPDVPVYTTPAVATEIQSHGYQRLSTLHAKDSDVPVHVTTPSPSIEERTHDMVGEIELELLPLGPAESENSLAIFIPKTGELISGDVVGGGDHLDLTWGRSVVWQDRIAELKALDPKWIYPGHGTPGGPELLDQTLEYLKFFHDAVAEKVKPGAAANISAADLQDTKRKMLARFPKLGRPELIERSVRAEYAVQLAALPPAAPAPGGAPGAAPAATPSAGAAATTPPAAAAAPPSQSSSAAVDDLLGTGTSEPKSKKKKKK